MRGPCAWACCGLRAQDSYQKYDELANRHVEVLRRLTKQIQDARIARDNEAIKRAITEYDEALEAYIPGLMAMAQIYWDMENYMQVRFETTPLDPFQARPSLPQDGPYAVCAVDVYLRLERLD